MKLLVALSVVAIAAPTIKYEQDPLTTLDLRLISTSQDKSEWMTETQIFQLYKNNIKFIDITDGDWETLGLYNKLNIKTVKPTFPKVASNKEVVKKLIQKVDQSRMKDFLTTFSGFNTRYYKSKWGKDSATWLFDQLETIGKSAGNGTVLTVEKVIHSWDQFSIIARYAPLTAKEDDEVVILSAHQDSINLWNPWFGRSPGADDDGSGTTTIIEALRVLVDQKFVPKRPLEFHFYSAEEGGLLGSQKVASKYMKQGRKVFGVLHNDMTGYQPKGVAPIIGINTDNIDEDLTDVLRLISSEYSGIAWKNTNCGYACSDHASWTKAGVPSCFTFEAEFDKQSPYIHTTGDTVDTLSFEHMSAFVNNCLGFAVEMSYFEK